MLPFIKRGLVWVFIFMFVFATAIPFKFASAISLDTPMPNNYCAYGSSSSSVKIQWDYSQIPSDIVKSYFVEIQRYINGAWVLLDTVKATDLSKEFTNLPLGKYEYRLRTKLTVNNTTYYSNYTPSLFAYVLSSPKNLVASVNPPLGVNEGNPYVDLS